MVRPPPQPLVILGTGLFSEELADLVPQIPGFQVAGFVHCDEIPLPMPDHLRRLVGSVRRLVRRWTGRNMDYWRQVFPPLRWLDRVIQNSPKGEGEASPETEGPRRTLNGLPIFSSQELFDLAGNHLAISGMNLPGYRHRSTALADTTGIGAVLLNNLTVEAQSVVGGGAVVTRNVPNNVQVVGVPAKVVKKNITEDWERESFYG